MLEKGYGASVIGKAHIKLKKSNQDSYLIANEDEYTLAVVCDGLGSKKYSQIGSKKLCKVIKKQINKCFNIITYESYNAFLSKVSFGLFQCFQLIFCLTNLKSLNK